MAQLYNLTYLGGIDVLANKSVIPCNDIIACFNLLVERCLWPVLLPILLLVVPDLEGLEGLDVVDLVQCCPEVLHHV